jgi:hypothetical protein
VPEVLRPLEGRARRAVIALGAVITTDILAVGSDLLEIRLMNRLVDGEDVSPSSLDSGDTRQLVVSLVVLAVYVASIVLFIRWFHRAYSNLPALGSELRFKRGWAIGGWFVPIMWFWRPKQIANDIWRGTDPSTRSLHITKTDVAPLVGIWWAAWIIAGVVFTRSSLAYASTPTALEAGVSAMLGDTADAEDIRRAGVLDLVANGIDIAAAVLAILVVQRMTSRQSERERMLASLRESPPAVGSTPEVE